MSFYIPPASQLDASVFEALPEHYKIKISASYAKENKEKAKKSPVVLPKYQGTPAVAPQTTQETQTDHNALDIDNINFTTVFANLREWLQNLKEDGPSDNDVQSFNEYLINLLDNHMDVVYCILKHLWRKINQLQLTHWNPVYLQLLSSIQEAMQEKYNAPFNTDFIHY